MYALRWSQPDRLFQHRRWNSCRTIGCVHSRAVMPCRTHQDVCLDECPFRTRHHPVREQMPPFRLYATRHDWCHGWIIFYVFLPIWYDPQQSKKPAILHQEAAQISIVEFHLIVWKTEIKMLHVIDSEFWMASKKRCNYIWISQGRKILPL